MNRALKIILVAVLIFLYLPIILLVTGSFSSGTDLAVFRGFTFSNYAELVRDKTLIPLLLNSILVAVFSSVIAAVLGTMAALGIRSFGRRLRSAVMTVTNIPMTNPDIVTGVSLSLLFVFIGLLFRRSNVLGFATLLLAHITFNLPYTILSVMPRVHNMDPSLREAALDLGCTPVQAFFKVVIHELLPGIISGLLIAFTMSLDDFVISYFVYGPSFVTLPIEIYSYTKKPLPPKIYALFTLLFALLLAVLIVMNIVSGRDRNRPRRNFLPRAVFKRKDVGIN